MLLPIAASPSNCEEKCKAGIGYNSKPFLKGLQRIFACSKQAAADRIEKEETEPVVKWAVGPSFV